MSFRLKYELLIRGDSPLLKINNNIKVFYCKRMTMIYSYSYLHMFSGKYFVDYFVSCKLFIRCYHFIEISYKIKNRSKKFEKTFFIKIDINDPRRIPYSAVLNNKTILLAYVSSFNVLFPSVLKWFKCF